MQKKISGDIEKDFLGCLPELPEVARNFIELSRELNVTKKSYANLLLSDPLLQSRIFSYINLVTNPGNSEFISINKGISIMGLHLFKNIVTAFALFPVYQEANCTELYKYSLLTAFLCKDIASRFNFINPHDAFLLGFLHDVGKIALKNKFQDKYNIVNSDNDDIVNKYSPEEEAQTFGYCHFDISSYICRSWKMPVVVGDAIRYHHFPLTAMLPQASSVIYIADLIANKNAKFSKEDNKILEYMQLSKEDLVSLLPVSAKKIHPFFDILNIEK